MSEAITMTASLTATPGLWAILKEDLACVFQRDPAARSTLEVLTTYPGVHAVLTHRLSHRLWQTGWRFPARFLSFLGRTLTNVDIHPGATIGRRFFIDHGACVVIGETAEVGNDVTLYHGVTLGGPICIGERVRVGANSVVVKDVPADRTVVGVPGRIVDTRAGSARPENGISLDHNLLPDPVAKSIACLIERIEILEKELAEVRHQPPPADHSGQCQTCSAGDLCCEHESMH